ncbi:3259_t:CDS:1, partial [Dentiscutata heterogama]
GEVILQSSIDVRANNLQLSFGCSIKLTILSPIFYKNNICE